MPGLVESIQVDRNSRYRFKTEQQLAEQQLNMTAT